MKPAEDWGPLEERERKAEMEANMPLQTVIMSWMALTWTE